AIYLVDMFSESEESNAIIDLFSLLFYVAIISIPQTFYLYVISLSDWARQTIKWDKRLVHYYLPILLLIINIFSFFYLKFDTNEESSVYEVSVAVMNYSNFLALLFIFPVLNCFYIYKTIKTYRLHVKNVPEVFSFDQGVDLNWMLQYIIGYCVFIFIIYGLQLYSDVSSLNLFTGIFFTLYLLYIGFKGSQQKPVEFEKASSEIIIYKKESPEERLLDPEKIHHIKSLILDEVKKEPYLDKYLTIHQFSKSLGSNSKYVSKVLNSEFDQNFATFINFYRIEKAKELLVSETSSKYTIETISENVGFHSKSAFNKAFKTIVGETPSAFKRKHLK
ncbi:MAG: AraC family transcriptional regulator, partial [Psychroserpens sp.]|nr:AraC family transcriptional regulator [Psychroserpens sp.]